MDPAGNQADKKLPDGEHPPVHAPYPKLDLEDIESPLSPLPPSIPSPPAPAPKSVSWSSDLTREAPPPAPATMLPESNPYVAPSPAPSSTAKNTMETVRNVLGRWGKKATEASKQAVEATKKAEDLAGNIWQHLKTGPSFAEAAMGRIAQGTKVIAEGGYEKIFQQTFETLPQEQLKKSFACYLSTSAGPVMGILYLSTAKVAFCSDNPLSYNVGDHTEWSYYKVVIPLQQLRGATPSASNTNGAEKYIQIVSVDNHEFWFMGFVNYNGAVESLQEALHDAHDMQP